MDRLTKVQAGKTEKTRNKILTAAKKEFAKHGLDGARIDRIAEKSSVNKRMIYHYFGNKIQLFKTVLEIVYIDLRTAEQKLKLELLEPREALEKLVSFTWNYYLKNPELITIINSENLHRARHLKKSDVVRAMNQRYINTIEGLLQRGGQAGSFRTDVDPVQLAITIAAVGYYYLTNRFTGSILFERDLMTETALKQRLEFNVQTILRLVCIPPP